MVFPRDDSRHVHTGLDYLGLFCEVLVSNCSYPPYISCLLSNISHGMMGTCVHDALKLRSFRQSLTTASSLVSLRSLDNFLSSIPLFFLNTFILISPDNTCLLQEPARLCVHLLFDCPRPYCRCSYLSIYGRGLGCRFLLRTQGCV